MIEFLVKIHSVVDVITNSSTTIFTHADEDNIKHLKSLINVILKEAGSDKTADDLYTFELRKARALDEIYDSSRLVFEHIYVKLKDKEDDEGIDMTGIISVAIGIREGRQS